MRSHPRETGGPSVKALMDGTGCAPASSPEEELPRPVSSAGSEAICGGGEGDGDGEGNDATSGGDLDELGLRDGRTMCPAAIKKAAVASRHEVGVVRNLRKRPNIGKLPKQSL